MSTPVGAVHGSDVKPGPRKGQVGAAGTKKSLDPLGRVETAALALPTPTAGWIILGRKSR